MLLNTKHPRLFINDEKISKMKAQLKNDAFFRSMADSLISKADSLIDEKPVAFKIVGPRMLKNCQEIHSRISTLGLAYHLTDNKKYASRAVVELISASEYPHWNKDHFLDTAELITAFAIGYDWLFHVISEEDKAIIKNALITKGLDVGVELHAQKIWWAGHKFNWNQVCNGGLIIGALSIADEEPELSKSVFNATEKYLPIAFNSYGKDGGWEGGPDYWDYTTWYSVLLVDALLTNTGNDYNLSKTPGFDQTGLFPIYNMGNSGRQFNFADGDPDDTHKTYPAMLWLGNHFNLPASINKNNELLQMSIDNNIDFDAFNLVWYSPTTEDLKALPVNRVFSGIDAGYLRKAWDKNAISVAFKGGFNLADHAHLDMGTFVLDNEGERWASDLGRDNYDLPGYFERTVGGARWQYYRLNTQSHNTLILNKDNQREDATTKIVSFESNKENSLAVIDLSNAYDAYAKSVSRTFELTGNGLTIIDNVQGNEKLESIRWQMLTEAEIDVDGNEAALSIGDKKMYAKIIQPENSKFKIVSAKQEEPEMSNEGYQLLCFDINEFDDLTAEIVVEFYSKA